MNDARIVFRPLLAFLDKNRPKAPIGWQNWRILPVTGGWNSLLYRATRGDTDLAIKFSVTDERDRAGREYESLRVLQDFGLDITPEAVLLDRDGLSQPVMVQTWIGGKNSADLPHAEADGARWVEHMATIHTVTPDSTEAELRPAVLTSFTAAEALALVGRHLARIPAIERPGEMSNLVERCLTKSFPSWPRPSPTLCRVDSAIQNFVRLPDRWYSVDWENAGWGDPAFETADLLNHAAHIDMTNERRDWFVKQYCQRCSDPSMATRIWTYQKILVVWWVVRTYRYLYEMPRGLDPRLAQMPDNWEAVIQAKYEHYLAWGSALF